MPLCLDGDDYFDGEGGFVTRLVRCAPLSLSACNNVIKSNYRGYPALRQRDDYGHDRQSQPAGRMLSCSLTKSQQHSRSAYEWWCQYRVR